MINIKSSPENRLRNRSYFSRFRPAWLCVIACVFPLAVAEAQDATQTAEYREAFASAVRASVREVLPAVVTVESISAGGAKSGEVELDAPTSGLIIDADGYVLTSSLPVQSPGAALLITLAGQDGQLGQRASARLIARDFHRELALLKIESELDSPLTAVTLSSDPPDLAIGQTTVAVGRYGAASAPMVSTGILSATRRLDGVALQTDARISPAFYGGPLLDLYGNVIGILIPAVGEAGAENPTDWYDSGVAFAIDAATIARKLQRLKDGQDIKKGLIGIVTSSKDPNEKTTELSAVRPRSPAEAAGILAGDEIRSVAGIPVDRYGAIKQVLGGYDAGEAIAIIVDRDGSEKSFEITLAESIPPLSPQRLGVIARVANDGDEANVVVDAVIPSSPAAVTFKAGDSIKQLGKTKIDSVETLRSQLITAAPNTAIEMTLIRGEKETSVRVTPQSQDASPLTALPESLENVKSPTWKPVKLKLPEAATEAALVGPGKDADSPEVPLGLAVLLAKPGQTDAMDLAESWSSRAAQSGTVVLVVVSEDATRWRLNELETVRGLVAAAKKRFSIDERAVAISTLQYVEDEDASAADTMAIAAAVSMPEVFSAVAIHPEATPPAVRLRENDASKSQQIMLRLGADGELPAFASVLIKTGYPIVRGGTLDRGKFLSWVRLLQSI